MCLVRENLLVNKWITTHPPKTLLQALPEPLLATEETSPGTPKSLAKVVTRQAYPAAEEASPAAVGKLFSEQT